MVIRFAEPYFSLHNNVYLTGVRHCRFGASNRTESDGCRAQIDYGRDNIVEIFRQRHFSQTAEAENNAELTRENNGDGNERRIIRRKRT